MTLQLSWGHRYVFVDGPSYRDHPERLVLTRDCEPLPLCRAARLLTRLADEEPRMLERLRDALGRPRPQASPRDLARELARCLGPPSPDVFSPPGRFARVVVLERKERAPPPPVPQAPEAPPRSLAEIAASVSLALVDEWGNPGPSASFELLTPDGAERSGTLDEHGEALEENVRSGSSELHFRDLEGEHVSPRAAPPDGWLRNEVSILVRDAQGAPLAGLEFTVTFANGASRTGTLDAEGRSRLEGTPSWPLQVVFKRIDVEGWE